MTPSLVLNKSSIAVKPAHNLAELVHRLGDIPLNRILIEPQFGTATVEDLVALLESPEKVLCELYDGVLVEKVMGLQESHIAGRLIQHINNFLDAQDLGVSFGADGPLRIFPEQVRLPDVSVILWDSLPGREMPAESVPALVPDLTVEAISEGNTKKEMQRKINEYFFAGVKQVWLIYPQKQTAEIYTSPESKKRITRRQSLKGGDLLPGFAIPLEKLFASMGKRHKKK